MKSYQDKAGRIIQILEETDILVIGADWVAFVLPFLQPAQDIMLY